MVISFVGLFILISSRKKKKLCKFILLYISRAFCFLELELIVANAFLSLAFSVIVFNDLFCSVMFNALASFDALFFFFFLEFFIFIFLYSLLSYIITVLVLIAVVTALHLLNPSIFFSI